MRKLLFCLGLAMVSTAADEKQEVPPEAVVAVVNGHKMTADDVKKMVAAVPPQVQKAFTNDPKKFMNEYAWYMQLQAAAEKHGLDNQSPYRQVLEFQRMMTLVNAARNHEYLQVVVRPEQQKKFYDDNPERYRETQAKLIYIPFASGTEDQAKAKALEAVQQARGGVDFVKLVKEYSKDPKSAEQNGDMGIPIRSSSTQIPDVVKNAILALKPGQVSEPLRLENGYYVFRAESAGVLPYEKVKDEIYKELKDVGFKEWEKQTQAQSSVQFENEAFFQSIKQQQDQQSPAKQ